MSKSKDAVERHFLEAVLEGGEAALDLLSDNEAIKAVPVIGTAFKVMKGVDDLRHRALAAKLIKFLNDPSLQSESVKRKLKEGVATSEEEAQKIGECLFLVLDRMMDLQKPSLLARVFAAYLDKQISVIELRRLAHAIDSVFIDDLILLKESKTESEKSQEAWMQGLVAAGLARVRPGQTYGDIGQIYYDLTYLGITLRKVLISFE